MRFDADGFFHVLDRRKDMINHSGLKIYPGRVEKVLATHPQVREVAVVGRVDEIHTETVAAVVVPVEMPEHPEKLIEELRCLCREHLAVYEVPGTFEFVNELPRSALGKVLKKELRMPPAVHVPVELEVEKPKEAA